MFKILKKSPKTYGIIYSLVMIALSLLLIYYDKFIYLTLFPVVLNKDLPNEIGDSKFKCQVYIYRCPTKIKKLPLKKEINISNHVGIRLDPIDVK